MTSYLVAGDVGGTNSRLQLYEAPGKINLICQYQNIDYSSFTEVLRGFLQQSKLFTQHDNDRVVICVIAVAGPVKNNRVHLTNRDWTIDGSALEKDIPCLTKVVLCNDFLAQGYGLLTLDEDTECVPLHNPATTSKTPGGPIACIGAGTGLGECYLTAHPVLSSNEDFQSSYEYIAWPCEGGHAEFSPRNDVEYGLSKFLKSKYADEGSKNRVSMERVISGSGLPDVYEYLSQTFPDCVDTSLHEAINNGNDLKAAIIAKNREKNSLCRRTMDIFLTHYGSEAGVACLKWLPTSGLYITGGNTPKNIDEISNPDGLFMQALADKGRVSGILNDCPIYAVLVEDLGVRGAHFSAYKEMQHYRSRQQSRPNSIFSSKSFVQTLSAIACIAATATVAFAWGKKSR
eukprot:GSChrysophyteH1.ASY1.ANO1.1776.1 assembled CDS